MNTENKRISNIEVVNEFLLINWSDGTDSMILLETLRKHCPCAACIGEKDALGNVYKGPDAQLTVNSYILKGIHPVGYYGIRPYWVDGHNTGIYSTELLLKLHKI